MCRDDLQTIEFGNNEQRVIDDIEEIFDDLKNRVDNALEKLNEPTTVWDFIKCRNILESLYEDLY